MAHAQVYCFPRVPNSYGPYFSSYKSLTLLQGGAPIVSMLAKLTDNFVNYGLW